MVKARNLGGGVMAAMGAALLLAGCGSGDRGNPLLDGKAPCPAISILADGADLTRFRPGGGRDLTAMEFNASISGYKASCDFAPRNAGLDVTLKPSFLVERGPAATGRAAEMTYMVAVAQDGNPVAPPSLFGLKVEFPANVSRSAGEDEVTIRLPGTPAQAARRQIWISFQLSPEELALNRARGPR
ncbi:hypothetical protein NON00_18020 [Roseomonas sp. GC11]|uniref:hypothetical protein n=1 Tax=Roseomonas sp. GC11 TaxID=2950546 RepID=UPI0021087590|nr:hypothetical protein [Roseomonas sp. GC11]MCQ4161813.1 hypothetical protein [Roseomonas sp. GC11]